MCSSSGKEVFLRRERIREIIEIQSRVKYGSHQYLVNIENDNISTYMLSHIICAGSFDIPKGSLEILCPALTLECILRMCLGSDQKSQGLTSQSYPPSHLQIYVLTKDNMMRGVKMKRFHSIGSNRTHSFCHSFLALDVPGPMGDLKIA